MKSRPINVGRLFYLCNFIPTFANISPQRTQSLTEFFLYYEAKHSVILSAVKVSPPE